MACKEQHSARDKGKGAHLNHTHTRTSKSTQPQRLQASDLSQAPIRVPAEASWRRQRLGEPLRQRCTIERKRKHILVHQLQGKPKHAAQSPVPFIEQRSGPNHDRLLGGRRREARGLLVGIWRNAAVGCVWGFAPHNDTAEPQCAMHVCRR